MKDKQEIINEITGIEYDLKAGAFVNDEIGAAEMQGMIDGMKWCIDDQTTEYVKPIRLRDLTITGFLTRCVWLIWLWLKGWFYYAPAYVLMGATICIAVWLCGGSIPFLNAVGLAIAIRYIRNQVIMPGDKHITKKELNYLK